MPGKLPISLAGRLFDVKNQHVLLVVLLGVSFGEVTSDVGVRLLPRVADMLLALLHRQVGHIDPSVLFASLLILIASFLEPCSHRC